MTPDEIRGLIKDVPDFPKPGIVFKDITPVLSAPAAFGAAVELMAEKAVRRGADAILAIESRGFIFGAALARELALPLELVRKRGKLPRKSVTARYELEYGFDHLEVHEDALDAGRRFLVVDDVIATGGTAAAVAELVTQRHGSVAAFVFLIELEFLGGRAKLGGAPVETVIRF